MRNIIVGFRRLLFAIMDYLAVMVWQSSMAKTGVALIRLDAIGDFIIWLDSAKEYRRLFPAQKIVLLANTAWADLACGLPYWDEVWTLDLQRFTRKPLYRWMLLRKISQANFAVAIQPTFSRAFMYGDSVIRATRATQRIGSVGDMSNISAKDKAVGDSWYTRLLPASPNPLMELQRNAEFISHLTDETFKESLPALPILATLPKRLQPQSAYFILFPGASWHGRQWPTQFFIQLLERLDQHYGWQAVLCGSPAEGDLGQVIAHGTQVACLNLIGQSTLAELAELIRGARILIGNETSAVHFAAAVGTPAVCILGGGHFGRFMPYPDTLGGLKPLIATHPMPCFNCNWRCNQTRDPAGPVPCLSQISVELVMSQTMMAIEQSHQFNSDMNHATTSK
ncbi:MAG: glycosyltransferase family 9 protein [Ramlibacter sp.]|nr:glycosyltransferase family 9 protein [Ramlibacter sp.]